jgi:hypothetical protein
MKIQLDLAEQQVNELRQVMDWLPLARYALLICAVNKALPLESAVDPIPDEDASVALTALAATVSAVGFSLCGMTDKGKAALPELTRLLSRLPHTGDM